MARNYYTLVAGLREYTLDSDNKGFDAVAIKEEIREQLSDADRHSLDLFYNYYDIENILNIRAGRSRFSPLGNFSREQLVEEVKNPEHLPDYIAEVIRAYADLEDTDYEEVDTDLPFERSLFMAYYEKCAKSQCRFVRQWSEFDRTLRNVTAALSARRLGIPTAEVVVGDDYVADSIKRSSAADFGLRGELDYIDQIISALADETNLLEKENRIDMIRWRTSDSLTEFNYFDINTILAYLVKINIVHRWVSLDPQRGREMFRLLMESLTVKEE